MTKRNLNRQALRKEPPPWVLPAMLLLWFVCPSGWAHDPGLSAADARLERDKVVVVLNFAKGDLAGLLGQTNAERLAAGSFEVEFDGLPMPPSEVKVRPGEAGDMQFVLTFPREPAAMLTLRSTLLRKLSPTHRQLFSLRDERNRLLGTPILEGQKDKFDLALAAPPPSQWLLLLLGLAGAFGMGAGHALSPGHGKTLVAAYLVGSRGTAAHAVILGATVTITHTLGVFLLGLGTLAASQYVVPERLYPWIGCGSGLAIAGIGLSLLISRWKHGGYPPHHHHHDEPPRTAGEPQPFPQEGTDPHEHTHGHLHDHPHHDHDHGHRHGDDDHHHDHGHGHHHHHLEPGRVSVRQLVALGISGGIAPCPSALLVLMGALATHRVGYGLLLITAFSLGLASVLTVLGLLVVQGHRLLDRVQRWRHWKGQWMRWLPVGSAAVITLLGLAIAIYSLIGSGPKP
jgi:ABC-type nickel/cobalt efflux system permease component RcnA